MTGDELTYDEALRRAKHHALFASDIANQSQPNVATAHAQVSLALSALLDHMEISGLAAVLEVTP
ncbi:MAG: hypothetical protein ACRDUY_08125 [Nitriliruptorales bacterium]